MHENPFQETYRPYHADYRGGPARWGPGRGLVRTAAMWIGIAVLAMLALGAVTWLFGLVFHLAAVAIKIALVVAIVVFVWRRVTGRHRRHYDV